MITILENTIKVRYYKDDRGFIGQLFGKVLSSNEIYSNNNKLYSKELLELKNFSHNINLAYFLNCPDQTCDS